jgi:large subunit ribosomal protein L25
MRCKSGPRPRSPGGRKGTSSRFKRRPFAAQAEIAGGRSRTARVHCAAVAGERVKLQVQERESRGSAESRRLRKQGLIPGVLYGRGRAPHAICIPERELRRVLTGDGGLHAILDVVLEGQKTTHASILKSFQQDPVRGGLIHVDLQEVRLDQPIQARVVVELLGEPVGVTEGGVLSQVNREVTVEALPMEIPEHVELDVTGMAIGDTLRLSDLPVQDGIKFLDDPEETVLATVTMPTRIVEPEPEEVEGEELEEGELPEGEVPEGEAAEAAAEGEGEAPAGEQEATEE